MTQEALGERLGVTFQQVQKYETGGARITVSLLLDMAAALDCEVGTLLGAASGEDPPLIDPQLAVTPGALELLQHYASSNERERSALLGAARAMANRRRRR